MNTTTILLIGFVAFAGLAILYMILKRTHSETERTDPTSYIDGLKALLRSNHEQAFVKLKDTISADTSNVDAYIRLGDIFRQRKQPDQALQVHRDLTFRRSLTDTDKVEVLKALYYDFLDLEDESSAIKAAREILDYNPNNRFALIALLKTHEQADNWKDAATVRKKLDKIDGQDSNRMLALYKVFEGDDLNEKGDRHRARLFFKEAIHIDKNCLAAYIAIGDSYYNEGRLEDAIDYWHKVIAQKPEMGHHVFERLKKGFFEIGRYGEYADALSGLLQACPEHKSARLELAYFQEKKGEHDSARENYIMAQDNNPESMLVKLGLYRLNLSTNRKEAAENLYKQIMKLAVKNEVGNYRCQKCNLESQNMIWLCPRCKAVDSFEPVNT